jgi:uncharacterized protein (TIGR03435 family)
MRSETRLLSANLNAWVDRLVVDRTGPSIFSAIEEQLRLKLQSATGPVDVLVIDHVEKPTPD